MKSAQYKEPGVVLIHPTTCSSLTKIRAFQQNTGLQVVVSNTGKAHAIPCSGGAV
ncbi:hypothetical protein [Pseudomonas shirazensis]|uniref:hypothetical protein n=1 Tax=Pseudomonas shirazensis TaxID=2745494 RepID=UPI0016482211|nr:hypothetical protein [Pseudomonas shirazensis]MBV4500762.1 hypothetical protein [Pseudomonas shirazensis]